MRRTFFLLAAALTPLAADAALFKCVASDGHFTYRDTPCTTAARAGTVDPAPPASSEPGLRPGEREMLERAYRRDERARTEASRVETTRASIPIPADQPEPARPRGRQPESVLETMAKSAMRAAGTQIGRQIIRGVLGSILGGARKR